MQILIVALIAFTTFKCFGTSLVTTLTPSELEKFGLRITENVEGNFMLSVPVIVDECSIISIESTLFNDEKLVLHSELANSSEVLGAYSAFIIFDPLSNFDLQIGARYSCKSHPSEYYDLGPFKNMMSIVK